MKNLILTRHAKSSWEILLKDIDRPLEKRGVSDANLVSMNCKPYLPDKYLICCSPAKRATDTAMIFAKNLSYPIENINFIDSLYTFDGKALEKVVSTFNNDYDTIILFGHNEAITNFVNKFGDVFIENVPTCGFVSIEFNTNDWQSLKKGKTVKTIFPKDLK